MHRELDLWSVFIRLHHRFHLEHLGVTKPRCERVHRHHAADEPFHGREQPRIGFEEEAQVVHAVLLHARARQVDEPNSAHGHAQVRKTIFV